MTSHIYYYNPLEDSHTKSCGARFSSKPKGNTSCYYLLVAWQEILISEITHWCLVGVKTCRLMGLMPGHPCQTVLFVFYLI